MSADNFRLSARVTTHGLNVHPMPGSRSIRGVLNAGAKVTITAYEQRPKLLWAFVEGDFDAGWVWAECLKFDPPPAPPPKPVELPKPETLPECIDPSPIMRRLVFWLGLGVLVVAAVLFALRDPGIGAELPDAELTPGVAVPMTMSKLCHTKWGKDARKVTAAMKREVFASYGLSGNHDPSCTSPRHFEIDHLISRELGGADVVRNLWPQCYGGEWNAVDKDRVENRLHKEVCAGRMTLAAAQEIIKTDWRKAWRRFFSEGE